jgi:hypothetical protein
MVQSGTLSVETNTKLLAATQQATTSPPVDFGDFCNSPEFSDITFSFIDENANQQVLYGHKCILSTGYLYNL